MLNLLEIEGKMPKGEIKWQNSNQVKNAKIANIELGLDVTKTKNM